MSNFIGLAETATLLACSRATVYRLIQDGKLTAHYKQAKLRTPLFDADEVGAIGEPQASLLSGQSLRDRVRKESGGRCIVCSGDYRPCAHHVVPVEIGGSDTANNLVVLCRRCHTSVHGSGTSMMKRAKGAGTIAIAEWLLSQVYGVSVQAPEKKPSSPMRRGGNHPRSQ